MLHPFEFPLPIDGGKMLSAAPVANATLAAGQRLVLFSQPKGTRGIVRNVSWICDPDIGLVLEIKYDGESTAAFSIPLMTCAGLEYPLSACLDMEIHTPCFELTAGPRLSSDLANQQPLAGNLRLPIPFTNGIEISVVLAAGSNPNAVYGNVAWQNVLPDSWNQNLRLMAMRSNEVVTAAYALPSQACQLTDSTHVVKTGGGTFNAGIVAGTLLIPDDGFGITTDMLVLERTDSTHLVVSAKDTVGAVLGAPHLVGFSPAHTFLTRPAGERGWIAAIVGACGQGSGGAIDSQFEADPRIFLGKTGFEPLDGEPDLTWTSTEDFANGCYYFVQKSRGEEGGISSHGPDLASPRQEFCVYKSFYKWPVRYVNGVRGTIPSYTTYATTFHWTTLFYAEVSS